MNKLILLMCLMFSTSLFAESIVFSCNTEKHTINIYKNADQKTFTYKSWNKPKTTTEKPDMELKSSIYEVNGSGECRFEEYRFKTGKTEFAIDSNFRCTEKYPPKNAIGSLWVFINDDMKSHYWCVK